MLWLQCLFYTELPFAEDLRQFTFGSLPVEEVDAAMQPLNRKFTPTGELWVFFCVKRSFYRAANAVFGKIGVRASEEVALCQGSQTRGPQATCSPRRRYLRPATHYLKFKKFGITIVLIQFTAFFFW